MWSLQDSIERGDPDGPELTPEQQARIDAHTAHRRAELLEQYPELRSRSFRRGVARCDNFAHLFTRTATPRTRGRARASHGTQAGHRRTASSRAGPDPDSDEPEPPAGGSIHALGAVA
jgi:hypothetical protein